MKWKNIAGKKPDFNAIYMLCTACTQSEEKSNNMEIVFTCVTSTAMLDWRRTASACVWKFSSHWQWHTARRCADCCFSFDILFRFLVLAFHKSKVLLFVRLVVVLVTFFLLSYCSLMWSVPLLLLLFFTLFCVFKMNKSFFKSKYNSILLPNIFFVVWKIKFSIHTHTAASFFILAKNFATNNNQNEEE